MSLLKHAYILLSVFLHLLVMQSASASDLSRNRVLLINSYHPTFHTMPKIIKGLTEGFGSNLPLIDIEYMDSKRLYNEKVISLFYQSLAYKIQHSPAYDVVVTADDNALNFILRFGHELFPETPVVFLGLNNHELAQKLAAETSPNMTGVVEAVSIEENIQLIQKLRPDIQTLYLISDGTPTGQSDLRNAMSFQKKYANLPFYLIDLSTITWDTFTDNLQKISPNDAILLMSAFKDTHNTNLSFEQSLELIMQNAKAPVFHLYDQGIGKGLLGGVLVSHEEHGRQAALSAKKILEGTPVSSIPIQLKSPNLPIFDYRELEKFNIPLSELPKNSQIRYQDTNKSVLVIYWQEIVVILIIMSLLCLLVAVLAHQNRTRKQSNRILEENELRLRTILDNVDAYIFMKDTQGHYLFANKSLCSLLGLSPEQIVSKTADQIYKPETAERVAKTDAEVFKSRKLHKKEEFYWLHNKDTATYLQTTKVPLINKDDELYGLCGISLDITAQKNHEQELQYIAQHDPLTGLPNRSLFSDRLQQGMKYADRNNCSISIMYFDLDGFKSINDRYGHDHGDHLLNTIANRVTGAIRKNDTVARLGGDEFVVLLLKSHPPENDLRIVHKLLNVISAPMTFRGNLISVTASFGISNYPQCHPVEADQLLRQADQAMYIAKNSGKNCFHFFNPQAEDNALKVERLTQEINKGLKKNDFRLFYQPKVDLLSGKIMGMEALIRWEHPVRGLLTPAEFLMPVKQQNIMIAIDEWVLREAIRQLNVWKEQNILIPISINISLPFFRQDDLVERIKTQLDNSPELDHSLLEFEILEPNAPEYLLKAKTKIAQCQQLGINFSLDNFGTGSSSLTNLNKLPIHQIKVDNSFVIDMLKDNKDMSILKGILALGDSFNIEVIAEGMETNKHRQELINLGFRFAQGYGIARPMPASDVVHWINHWHKPDDWD